MQERPEHVPVAIDQVRNLEMEALGDTGDALARVGRYVLFVRGALPGERVRARVVSAGRKHGRAELIEVLQPSPDRVTPRCRHFGECGGCQLQHMTYAAQLAAKTAHVRSELAHALGRDVEVTDIAAPPEPWGHRTKVALHVEHRPTGYRAGLYGLGSRTLVPLRECPAAAPPGFAAAQAALELCRRRRLPAWDPQTGDGCVRGVLARVGADDRIALVLISASAELPDEAGFVAAAGALDVDSLWLNHNPSPRPGQRQRVDAFQEVRLLGPRTRHLAGAERLRERVGEVEFQLRPQSFFQTSRFGAEQIATRVRRLLAAPDDATIVDVYSGVGLLAISLASEVAQVIAIEDDAAAVEDAEATARAAGLGNVRLLTGPAARLLPPLRQVKPWGVVVDPPRSGCGEEVLAAITGDLRPKRLVYVSCDLRSLATDARLLERGGYALRTAEPIDMFPLTHHLEVVARFDFSPQIGSGPRRFSRDAAERLLAKSRVPR